MVQDLTKKDAGERVKDHKGNSIENCNLAGLCQGDESAQCRKGILQVYADRENLNQLRKRLII